MNTKSKHNLNSTENEQSKGKKLIVEHIVKDILQLKDSIEIVQNSTDDILQKLIDSIGVIDFEILAFPSINKIRNEIIDLEKLITNEDGSLNTENKLVYEKYKSLKKELSKLKLTKNHYLIICIEQILKIAKSKEWGLCKKNNFIYLYNGCYWNEIDKERFQFFLGNVALKFGVEKFKGKIHTFKEELFKQFMSDAFLPTPKPKKNCVLINLLNGTFEITPKKSILREFRQSDFITHQLPFEYEPEATCNLFQSFLDEVLPDKDKQKVLAEYLGYIFTKNLKLEKMLILFGTGANGKSVVFEILCALLGSENISNFSLQSLTDENGYYRAKIGNKLVNYASEINGKLEQAKFKQMASGEPIEARLPYGEPFTLEEYAKLIFNCNELPKEIEHTNAFFRRFLILTFDVTIPENKQDKELPNKIINNELSGVFNWILNGLNRLLEQKKFSICEAVDNARSNYEKQSDSTKLFIDEMNYTVSISDFTFIKDLFIEYRTFCSEDGYKAVGKSNFIKRLEHHKIECKRHSLGWIAYVKNRPF